MPPSSSTFVSPSNRFRAAQLGFTESKGFAGHRSSFPLKNDCSIPYFTGAPWETHPTYIQHLRVERDHVVASWAADVPLVTAPLGISYPESAGVASSPVLPVRRLHGALPVYRCREPPASSALEERERAQQGFHLRPRHLARRRGSQARPAPRQVVVEEAVYQVAVSYGRLVAVEQTAPSRS